MIHILLLLLIVWGYVGATAWGCHYCATMCQCDVQAHDKGQMSVTIPPNVPAFLSAASLLPNPRALIPGP